MIDESQENNFMSDDDEMNEDFINNSFYFCKRGIFLPDGTYEPMLSPKDDMARLIGEHLGMDAEMYFRAILALVFQDVFNCVKDDIASASWEVDSALEYLEYALDENDLEAYDISVVIKHLKEVSERLDKYW